MLSRSAKVRVPATIGNFAGDPSCGALAIDAVMNVTATLRQDGHLSLRYFGDRGERVPRDHSNLIVQAIGLAIEGRNRRFSGANLEIYSSIPVGVGLGASTAAVWAGLIAADRLFELGLDEKSFFGLAERLEPRADNIRAAWMGGLGSVASGPERAAFPDEVALRVVIPETGDKGVPGVDESLSIKVAGATVFLCGSGPAVGILESGPATEAVNLVQKCFASKGLSSRYAIFHASNQGARDWNTAHAEIAFSRATLGDSPYKPTLIPV